MAPKAKKEASKELSEAQLNLRDLRIFYPILSSCTVDQSASDEKDDRKAKKFYNAVVQPVAPTETSIDVAFCEFAAGKRVGDVKIIEIKASYFIGFRLGERKLDDHEKNSMFVEMAQAAAWPLFRDLYILIGSQSREDLPLLPFVPKVIVAPTEATESEQPDQSSL
jgi:hypothetical protein